MNNQLKVCWKKYVEQPASIANWLEALGLRCLDLDEAFEIYHPCVQEKRLPEEMPAALRKHFFSSGYVRMEQLSKLMLVIGYRRCLVDEDKIPSCEYHPSKDIQYIDADYEKICADFDAYYDAYYNDKVMDAFVGKQFDFQEDCRDWMDDLLRPFYPKCLTDSLREVAVRGHARGMSTTVVINDLIFEDEDLSPFAVWKHDNVCGAEYLRTYLHPQLVYLKASSPRFPKKYRAAWVDERERFQQALTGVPMSTAVEQVQALSDHYEKLVEARDAAEDVKDVVALSNAIVKTVAGLYTLTRDPFYQNQLEVLKQKEVGAIGASEEGVLVHPEYQGVLDTPDAGMLAPPKESPIALTNSTELEEKKGEPIRGAKPSEK